MKRKTFQYPPAGVDPLVLRETGVEEAPLIVNVRAAKDQLSSLLEQAARGDEVIITSDGRPKAKLVAVRPRRRLFRTDWALLRSMPVHPDPEEEPRAEDLVRADRDGRW